MSVATKRVKAPKDEPSGSILPNEATSWRPVTRCPALEKLMLLGVAGGVWNFKDPGSDRLYRCEVDPDGNERWFFIVIPTESELISQSDAARLIGVSRQAIRNAIVWKRLGTAECNGRTMVSRADVLALPIDPRQRRVRKS